MIYNLVWIIITVVGIRQVMSRIKLGFRTDAGWMWFRVWLNPRRGYLPEKLNHLLLGLERTWRAVKAKVSWIIDDCFQCYCQNGENLFLDFGCQRKYLLILFAASGNCSLDVSGEGGWTASFQPFKVCVFMLVRVCVHVVFACFLVAVILYKLNIG